MKKLLPYTVALLGFVLSTYASFGQQFQSIGARALGLGNANLTLTDVWSSNNNQAAMAFAKSSAVGAAYQNNFQQQELALKSLNGLIKTGIGAFGVAVQQFGFTDYNENKFSLSYGIKMNAHVAIGANINYHLINVSEIQTPNRNGISADISLHAEATENLRFSALVTNVSNSSLSGTFEEKIPMNIKIGMGYHFSEKLLAVIELDKNIDYKANFKAGLEYAPIAPLFFRAGFSSYDFKMAFGMGYDFRGLQLDLGTNYQTYLGYVTQISLHYALGKKE